MELRLLSSFERSSGSAVRWLEEEKRPGFAGVTRDAERSRITAVGRAAGERTLAELAALLERAGVAVLEREAGEGRVTLKVAPEQLLPALELVHSALFL